MKKIFSAVVLGLISLFLIACVQTGGNVNPVIPAASVKLNHQGQLNQVIQTEETLLQDIKFTVEFVHFEENEIDASKANVVWWRNGLVVETSQSNLNELVVSPKLPGSFSVYAVVTITDTDKVFTTATVVATVFEQTAQLSLSTTRTSGTTVELVAGEGSPSVDFKAVVTGNSSFERIEYVVTKFEDGGSTETTHELLIQNGQATFNHSFNETGYYQVDLRFTKFKSNYIYVNVTFGEFAVSLLDGNQKIQTSNYSSRTLTVSPIHENDEIGAGTYQWFVDGVAILNANSTTFEHTDLAQGGYLYHVEFTSNSGILQKTDPFLVVNGTLVTTETDLLAAIENVDVAAIVLGADIMYNHVSDSIVIDRKLTIVGQGFTLSSLGIFTFILVEADDVYFSDITIAYSSRYNLLFQNVVGGYVENTVFTNAGDGGMTDPGAGIYAFGSEVTVKDVTVNESYNSGIRLDPFTFGSTKVPAKVTMLGTFTYDVEELFFPIVSIRGTFEEVTLVGNGYEQFILPLQGNAVIRRWSNDANPISWSLGSPSVTEYTPGAKLDVLGIAISVTMLGQDPEPFGLEFVYLFLNMFDQYASVEITTLDDEPVNTYYVVGYSDDLPGDKLIYHDQPIGGSVIQPLLPTTPGQYKVRLTIGGELYLGFFVINITE